MSAPAIALIVAIVLAVPAAVVASWRIWPAGEGWNRTRLLDALWTVVPTVLLIVLLGLSAGAGL